MVGISFGRLHPLLSALHIHYKFLARICSHVPSVSRPQKRAILWRTGSTRPDLVIQTGVSYCSTPHSPMDTKNFALATRGRQAARASKNYPGRENSKKKNTWRCICRYEGLVHWAVATQNYDLSKQYFNTFFASLAANEHAASVKFRTP